jgi:hypothetical protein
MACNQVINSTYSLVLKEILYTKTAKEKRRDVGIRDVGIRLVII